MRSSMSPSVFAAQHLQPLPSSFARSMGVYVMRRSFAVVGETEDPSIVSSSVSTEKKHSFSASRTLLAGRFTSRSKSSYRFTRTYSVPRMSATSTFFGEDRPRWNP